MAIMMPYEFNSCGTCAGRMEAKEQEVEPEDSRVEEKSIGIIRRRGPTKVSAMAERKVAER